MIFNFSERIRKIYEGILIILIGIFSIYLVIYFIPSNETGQATLDDGATETATIKTVIEITDAKHLDSNRNFISDITNNVHDLDGKWSGMVSDGEYVRIAFEQPLDSRRDITIFPRTISGNPRIEVYEVNSDKIITTFSSLKSSEYNKVFLTNLKNSQDIFDLHIVDGSVEFDHVYDPTEELNVTACTATGCSITNYNINDTSVGSALAKNARDDVNISATVNLEAIDTINSVTLHFKWTNRVNLDGTWQITPQSRNGLTNYCAAKSVTQTDLNENVYVTIDIFTSCVDTKTELDDLRLDILNADAGGGVTGDVLYVDVIIDYTDVVDNPPQWQNPSVNDTTPDPNQVINHQVNWTDDINLSYATLEVNGTGANCDTTANVSNVLISGTQNLSNLSWAIPNSCEGKSISWRQYANDSLNQWNVTATQTYTVNNINPIASFGTNPIDNLNSSTGSITFELKGSDNLGVSFLRLYGNWSGSWTFNQTNSSPVNDTIWSVTVNGIPEGRWRWAAWVNDTSVNGNQDFTDTNRTLTVDLTKPNVTINSPANQTYNTNSATFNVTSVDNFNVNNCQYSLDGASNISLTNSAGNFWNATNSSMTEGSHTATYYCTDFAGNVNGTQQVTFFIDSVVPQIQFVDPTATNGTSASRTWIFANVTITEANFQNVTFKLFNSTGLLNTTTLTDSTRSINFTGLSNSNIQYWYNVSTYDSVGNTNQTETRYITLTSDQSPIMTILYPENTTYNVNVSQLNYSATDDISLSYCWYSLDSGSTNSTPTVSCPNFTGLTSNQGSNTWIVYANDSLNQIGSNTVTFFKDTIFPQFTNHQRNPATPNEDQSVQVNVTVTETNKDKIILEFNNGTSIVNRTVSTSNGDEFFLTVTSGNYTAHDLVNYSWYANDTAGNMNKSALQSFTVANQVPSVTEPTVNDTAPKTNDLISCNGGTFSDNDGEDSEQNRFFQWYNNNVFISGQTSQTLSLTASGLDKGDVIKCSVLVFDGFDNSTFANSSNTATIQNTAPTITNPQTSVNWDANGSAFTYQYTAADADADGIIWYDNTTLFDINGTGYISDTPAESEAGIYAIRISASDAAVNATDDFTYTINDVANPSIQFVSPAEANSSTLGRNYIQVNVSASDTNLHTITIRLYNSSNALIRTNYSSTSPFFINYTGLTEGTYYFNATANDTLNNLASTETRTVSLAKPSLTIILPENETYFSNISLHLNFSVSLEDSIKYNLNNTTNTTISGNTTFNVTTEGSHTLYLFAINSVGTTAKNVTFAVNATKFRVIYNNYKNNGSTTEFNVSSYEDIQNLSGVVLEKSDFGKINFNQKINLTNDSKNTDNSIDIDSYTTISQNFIDVNTTALPNLNKSATLSFYNLDFTDPRILRDGSVCPATICTEVSYSAGILVFNVTHFTSYSAEETPASAPQSSGAGGSSSGNEPGRIPECTQDAECDENKACLSGRCVNLFDIKITDFNSPVRLGEFFEFTYFVKGVADINDDVEISFWIENETKKVTSGADVIYLGSFDEKTESTKIFLPSNIQSGVYQFYVQVTHGLYIVNSHRTIEIEVGEDGVAKIRNITPLKIPIAVIITIILVLAFAGSGLKSLKLMEREHKIKTEFDNLIKTSDVKISGFSNSFVKSSRKIRVRNGKQEGISEKNVQDLISGIKIPQIKVLPTPGFGQIKTAPERKFKPKVVREKSRDATKVIEDFIKKSGERPSKELKPKDSEKSKEDLDKILDDLEKEKKDN